MHYRETQKAVEFKTKLGFNLINLIMPKEGSMTTIIIKSFPGVKMIEQYFVLGKKIDLYLPDHKLAIEVDEKINQKKKVGCKFIRINPDSENFNINIEIGKICNHINESNKKIN